MNATTATTLASIQWIGDETGHLRLLDQTCLPTEVRWLDCQDVESVWEAIKMLRVRGAPAIGIAAAYAVVLSVKNAIHGENRLSITEAQAAITKSVEYLSTSRPTAVNLFWALQRMQSELAETSEPQQIVSDALRIARNIHDEDRAMCHAIGKHGATLIHEGDGILTHCNAGGLATSEYGTALSTMFTAFDQGKSIHVWVDETRPLLQGSRLTAFELKNHGVRCTLICDSMAAQVMREGRVQCCIVGADRITACGDAANKIGTYGVAVLAKHHGIPFYVAAPSSTFDLSIESGQQIPIEQRSETEIVEGFGKRTAPEGVITYNPAFDVTPAELITGIITERGVIKDISQATIRQLLSNDHE